MTIIIPTYREKDTDLVVFECRLLFPHADIVVGNDEQGQGKGYIIKQSMTKFVSNIVVMIDGDGDISPAMINRLLPFLVEYDIVVGTKGIRGLPLRRKIITILSRMYIRLFFGLKVDTQTGIKVFRRYKIPEWESKGFIFDLEILAKAKKHGIKMIEVPIEAKISKTKSMRVLVITLWESLKLWYRLFCL